MLLFAVALAAEPDAQTPASDGLTDVATEAERADAWSDALRQAVDHRWNVHVRAIDDNAMPRPDTYVTAVDVTLNPNGTLVTVVVTQPSGAAELDAAVVSAFRDVARFEAPPPALIDATGTATARNLRFSVDLGYNGFDWDLRHFPGVASPPSPSLHALRTWARAEGCFEGRLQPCPAALALAAALQERGRPATALAVLRAVPDRSPAMLGVFVEASEALGDTSDLADLALEVPAHRVPEALRPTFDEARKHWSRVPEWSPEWDDAALGMAWTDRMSGARAPELVEAWSPAVEQLKGALARQDVGFAEAYDALDLPKPLRRRIEFDEGVRGLRAHLAQIKRERLWGDGVLLDGERARVTRRLDARLSGRVRCEVGRLRDGWGLDGDRRDCEVLDAAAPRRR